jgi:hypothetical protein
MSKFVVIGYYTEGSGYAQEAAKLKISADRFGLESYILPVPDLGSWQKNVQFKAEFILQMLDDPRTAGRPVVYVDADAEFKAYPELFDRTQSSFACGFLDHQKFGRLRRPWRELIGSTLYFANNGVARGLLIGWITENKHHPEIWDQRNLRNVLDRLGVYVNREELPETYFKIFDTMRAVENPVIEQYQKSRIYRRRAGWRIISHGNV